MSPLKKVIAGSFLFSRSNAVFTSKILRGHWTGIIVFFLLVAESPESPPWPFPPSPPQIYANRHALVSPVEDEALSSAASSSLTLHYSITVFLWLNCNNALVLPLLSRKNAFEILWSKVTRFITTRLRTSGKTLPPTSPLDQGHSVHSNLAAYKWQTSRGRLLRGIIGKVHWINLPPELCEEIGKRIESRLDIVRFRSVCKNWRSSLPSPARFPLQVPPLPNFYSPFHNHPFFVITEVNFYHVNTEAVVVVLEELAQGGKFRNNTIYPQRSTNLSDHRLSQFSFVSKAYFLRIFEPHVAGGKWDVKFNKFAKKVVIIYANATDGVNPSYDKASDLSIVAHLACGDMKGRLALLRLGGSPRDWVWDTGFCTQVFNSIGTYRGRLCMDDGYGNVFLMDYRSLRMTRVAHPVPEHLFDAFEYWFMHRVLAPLIS